MSNNVTNDQSKGINGQSENTKLLSTSTVKSENNNKLLSTSTTIIVSILMVFLFIISISVLSESINNTNNTLLMYILAGSAILVSAIGLLYTPFMRNDTLAFKSVIYLFIMIGILMMSIAIIGLVLVDDVDDIPVRRTCGKITSSFGIVLSSVTLLLFILQYAYPQYIKRLLTSNNNESKEPQKKIV